MFGGTGNRLSLTVTNTGSGNMYEEFVSACDNEARRSLVVPVLLLVDSQAVGSSSEERKPLSKNGISGGPEETALNRII